MEDQIEKPLISSCLTTGPLYKGRSFACYRDVNKAIEKHRELFGLRLSLRRSVKLENYCLTVEQMRDLNLRLKYGELDYNCFVATGRPGRPGNEGRCPQLVRLKLSPDARKLVVYESHNHDILPNTNSEGLQKTIPVLKQKIDFDPIGTENLGNTITLTPINPVQRSPVLILPKPASTPDSHGISPSNFIINNNNSFSSLIPISQSTITVASTISDVNSVTITPTPPPKFFSQRESPINDTENHGKITVRIKKSQVAPNEMVVVGSERDTEEQLKTKGSANATNNSSVMQRLNDSVNTLKEMLDQITPPKPNVQSLPGQPQPVSSATSKITGTNTSSKITTSVSAKLGHSPKVVSSNPKPIRPKISQKVTTTSGSSPSPTQKSVSGNKTVDMAGTQKGSSPTARHSLKSPLSQSQKQNIPTKVKSVDGGAKPTILKQSPNMKQIIIKNPPVSGSGVKSTQYDISKVSQTDTTKPQGGVNNNKLTQNEISKSQLGQKRTPGYPKPNLGQKPVGDKGSVMPNQTKKLVAKQNSTPKSLNSKHNLQTSLQKTSDHHPRNDMPKNVDKMRVKQIEKHLGRPNDKVVKSVETSSIRQSSASPHNGVMGIGGSRLLSIPKRLKRRPGRPPDTSVNSEIPRGLLDTELGYGEKQSLAHGVLLQLLSVTSQLPMVEFSHALDTLEVLTDAFRLGQRVTLSIRHDHEDISHNVNDSLVDRHVKTAESRDTQTIASGTEDENESNGVMTQDVLSNSDLLKILSSVDLKYLIGFEQRNGDTVQRYVYRPKSTNTPEEPKGLKRNTESPLTTHEDKRIKR